MVTLAHPGPGMYAYTMTFQKWLMETLNLANTVHAERPIGDVLTDALIWVNEEALPHINIREITDPNSPVLYHWLCFVENKW